ncbi:hypothetical protein [Actinomycetospora straminea]|uniref:Uncharacterized protein n=1 Tax=Actinomycetospora straminea TaxID=663607 RepID=A0ABP9EWC6_9PSEU|nr:hypothetical protein [Actinomycetospora straminea]MDD7932932.1 hypothetical protein [Actinomycetospora straminea]
MTAPDPDPVDPARPDPARPDTAGPTGPAGQGPDATRRPDLPDDVDAAFASIVADWAAEGAPRWPDEEAPEAPEARTDGPSSGLGTATPPHDARPPAPETPSPGVRRRPEPPAGPAAGPPAGPPRGQRPTPPRPAEDEHFVPPEPPPLPRLGLSSLLGLALLVVGVVLLAVPGLLGGPVGLGIIPGLLAMTAGLGWLVFGLRRGREPEGPDDGAVL